MKTSCPQKLSIAFAAALTVYAGAAASQAYPVKPVSVIVPFAPGGSVDSVGRMVMARLAERLGQPVVLDNVAGAGGVIGTQKAAGANPDGYTLLFSVESSMVIAKLVTPATVKYDGLKDFAPISLVGSSPLVLAGKNNLPAKNAAELLALLKANPGKFSYATSGIGSSLQIGGELVNQAARVNMVHVPYKVGAQMVTDLAGNQIDLAVLPLTSAREPARGGRIRAFGVMAPKRWSTAPEIPSLAEVPEFKGVEVMVWFGLFAPARTDPNIVARLAGAMDTVLGEAEIVKRLADLNLEPSRLSPQQFAAFLQREQEKFAAVVKAANIKAE